MTLENPHMLPKVRSKKLTQAVKIMPCYLKIASFAGMPCSGRDTNVICHLPTIGKGASTKVSDLYGASGCATCHDLLDERNELGCKIRENYPHAYYEQLMRAGHATLGAWVSLDLIKVSGGKII